MPDFVEIVFHLKEAHEENAEIVLAFLSEAPFTTFSLEGSLVKAYGKSEDISKALLDELAMTTASFTLAAPEVNYIEKQNWNALWEKNYFQPSIIENRVGIRATFQAHHAPVDMDIVIQPQMSFGTGHHSTTQLMVQNMLKFEDRFKSSQVLDMGAGTGILAIVAEKLGAGRIVAIDIEDWAARNIEENAVLNACSRITALQGDAALLKGYVGIFRIVLANIQKTVLLEDAENYAACMAPDSLIFLSGFYEADLNDIRQTYEALAFRYLTHGTDNSWCCAVFAK